MKKLLNDIIWSILIGFTFGGVVVHETDSMVAGIVVGLLSVSSYANLFLMSNLAKATKELAYAISNQPNGEE